MGEPSVPAKLVSEFLGTFVLVFTVGCNVLSGQAVWGGVSIACSLMVMIYACANSSGSNFNPAVSFALVLQGALKPAEMAMYWVAQLAGGIGAAFAYSAMFGKSFNLAPTPGHTPAQAAAAELLYTFMLVFVILNTACSKGNAGKEFFGVAIGFVIIAAAYSGGSVSGGCFNPAVAIGIDLSSFQQGFGVCLYYTVFELLGAGAAYGAFKACRPGEEEEKTLGSRLLCEFIGTFFLVLTVGLNVLGASTAGAFSIACALMCMIYALGDWSGAHFNPAVTVSIMASGKSSNPKEDALYMVSQIAGGVCAAFTYAAMKGGKTFGLKPATSTWQEVVIAEFVFTFVLAFVVHGCCCVQDEAKVKEFFGLAIGMCVTVGGCAIGSISGGSLNPAVSFGIAGSHAALAGGAFVPALAYTAIELAAGATAGAAFRVVHSTQYDAAEPLKNTSD